MEISILLFLLLIFYLGIKTSHSDIKEFKIKNKDLIHVGLLGVLLHIVVFVLNYLGIAFSNIDYKYLLINIILTCVLAIGLWQVKIWSSADSKLFMLYSLLVPVEIYRLGTIQYFGSFTILTHAFVLIILVMLFQMLKNGTVKKYLNGINEGISKENFSLNILGILFIIHWFIRFVLKYIDPSYIVIISVFTFLFLGTYLKELFDKYKYLLIILVCVRLVIDSSLYSVSFLIQYVGILVVYCLILLFQHLPSRVFSNKITLDKLRVGMILRAPIVMIDSKYVQLTPIKAKNMLKGKDVSRLKVLVNKESRGINASELKLILKNYDKRIEIEDHTCFAPYLFAGVLITILCEGSLFYWVLRFVSGS